MAKCQKINAYKNNIDKSLFFIISENVFGKNLVLSVKLEISGPFCNVNNLKKIGIMHAAAVMWECKVKL